jgi:cell division protein FtsB
MEHLPPVWQITTAALAALASVLTWIGNKKTNDIHVMLNSQREKMMSTIDQLRQEISDLKHEVAVMRSMRGGDSA